MHGLDLFSGIGAMSLGLSEWIKSLAYCERNRLARRVLLSRMGDRQLHTAPIWDNPWNFPSKAFVGKTHIVTASLHEIDDAQIMERGGKPLIEPLLFLVKQVQPDFVFVEYKSHSDFGIQGPVERLEAAGYDTRWLCVSHQSERSVDSSSVFALGRLRQEHPEGKPTERERYELGQYPAFKTEPRFYRMGQNIPPQLDQARLMINSQRPAVIREAFKTLGGL